MTLHHPRLQEIANATWASVLDLYLPDSCILATRVLGDVLSALGITRFKPIGLSALFMNAPAARHSRRHLCLCTTPQCQLEPAARVVGLGERDELVPFGSALRPKWRGHLGAIVDGRFLVDISAPQVNGRADGIHIDCPVVVPVTRRFIHGTDAVDGVENYGQRIVYFARPDVGGYKTDFDWYAWTSSRRAMVAATLARLRGERYVYPREFQVILNITGRI